MCRIVSVSRRCFQSPAAPKKGGNPEAAKVKNPVAASPESVAAGKRVYTRMCGRCHGAEGKGDGTRGDRARSRSDRRGVGLRCRATARSSP